MARVKKVHPTPSSHLGVLRRVEAHGLRLGRGGNKNWLYVGTGLWTLRTIRRMAERREEILISEPLLPGQRLIISNNRPTIEERGRPAAPKGRRARKQQRKAEAKAAEEQAKRDQKAAKKDAKLQTKAARGEARRPKKVAPTETVLSD